MQKRAGIRDRCPSCRLNNNLCLCKHILPFEIMSKISLIVHVSELKLTSNTAWFVNKLLPQNSEIFVRGRVGETFEAAPVMEATGNPFFLYPHDDAVELNAEFKEKYSGPYHLIIPDGNWHQARRVRKREEVFKSVPAVKLPSGILGGYRLRKAPQPDWVSTFEAAAYALGILEGEDVRERMLSFFRLWVRTSIFNRTKQEPDF
jgi:DTW domain-containing protein YfiP